MSCFKTRVFQPGSGLLYWREKIFLAIVCTAVILGTVAYFAGLLISLNHKTWNITSLITVIYILILFVFIFRKISFKIRIFILLLIIYLMSVLFLIFLGPYGAGFIWLLAFSVAAAFLLGFNAALLTILINLLTVIVMGFDIQFNLFGESLLRLYTPDIWLLSSLNLLIINILSALPLSIILNGLDNSLEKEKQLQFLLTNEKEKLIKAKQKAEEADNLKSQFLANMSHEIRTPMNGIIGFSQLLKKNKLTVKERKYYVDLICSRGHHLLQIINDIIDISKLEAKQLEIRNETININRLLQDLYHIFHSQLRQEKRSNIAIMIENYPEDIDLTITSDYTKLEQVLINLINNALKFTDKGEIKYGYYQEDEFVTFYVSDTGQGIPAELHQTIFERFMKINKQREKIQEGTGLGLAISKGIINLLNGKIWVKSEPEKGSVFFFTIPYKPADGIQNQSTRINLTKMEAKNWENKTILIVEDDEVSNEFLKVLLSPTKARLLFATDGRTAIELFKKYTSVSLVLMDVQLPVLNGQIAMEEMKKLRPDVPIIAQTAFAMVGDKEKYLDSGFSGYIAKPINPNDLLLLVDKFFS